MEERHDTTWGHEGTKGRGRGGRERRKIENVGRVRVWNRLVYINTDLRVEINYDPSTIPGPVVPEPRPVWRSPMA